MDNLQLIADVRLSNYIHVSAVTVFAYDLVRSFPEELEHIWKSKWSLIKTLYLISRYYGAFLTFGSFWFYVTVQKSLEVCRLFLWFSMMAGGATVLLGAVNWILIIRLTALYKNSNTVWALLCIATFAELAAQTYILSRIALPVTSGAFLAPPGVPIAGCLFVPTEDIKFYATLSWTLPVVLSTIYFGMSAYQMYYRNVKSDTGRGGVKISPLVKTFFTDGTICFFIVEIKLIAGLVMSLTIEGPLQLSYFLWGILVHSMAGSHLILHLRQAASGPEMMDEVQTKTPLAFHNGRGAIPLTLTSQRPGFRKGSLGMSFDSDDEYDDEESDYHTPRPKRHWSPRPRGMR